MISVSVNTFNDGDRCDETIASIRETATGPVEITVVDDGSTPPYIPKDKHVKLFRLNNRIGSGASRHLAILRATSKWTLAIDSHMRFTGSWYEECRMLALSSPPNLAWCGQCLGLNAQHMDVTKPLGRYYGAYTHFVGPDKNNQHQVLEAKWGVEQVGDHYPIATLQGACYLFNREQFLKLNGLAIFKSYGSEEVFYSLKHWLTGGEIRMAKRITVGHEFRGASKAVSPTSHYVWNKLAIAATCCPEQAARVLIDGLPKQYKVQGDIAAAHRIFRENLHLIEVERALVESLQTRPFEAYLERFGTPKFY